MRIIFAVIPASFKIGSARSAAFVPAPSLSKVRYTSFTYRLIRAACPGVNAVPSEATALLNPAQVTDSDVFFVDFMLYQMARSYFDAGSMEKSPRAQQANIIEHVTENFPATYITDGNYMSFASQARDFVRKLEKLGVEHEYLNFNSDEFMGETIMQGYDVQNNEFADLNRGKMVEFLSKQVTFAE